jgi:RNA polymerase sigma factor (sigma-70 family)
VQTRPLNRLLGRVRRTLAAHQTDDATLLRAYRDEHDPDALDALVRKHAPLVHAACRKVLPDSEADDVFQATFLVLMRDAKSIRKGQSVGSWLYGVAHRLALQARVGRARRSRIEGKARTPVPTQADPSWKEACVTLHEELDRLPDKYRLPLLLCYLDGKSRDEAAAELGWSLNVVRGHLERGREQLRRRLERRGIGLSAGLLATVLGNSVTAGGPPARLVEAALRGVKGRPSAAASALAHGVSSMSIPLKATVAGLVALAALAVGVWPAAQLSPVGAQTPPADRPAPKETDRPPDPLAPAMVEVSGRVVDPDGKPVPGARVTYQQERIHDDSRQMLPPPSSGETDRDGRFRFKAAMFERPSTSGQEPIGMLSATAPGFAPAGTGAGLPASLADRTLKLARDDVPLENRFVDLEGQPIAGVKVTCVAVIATPDNDLKPWLKELGGGKAGPEASNPGMMLPAEILGLSSLSATSDKDGRIKLSGIGRGRIAGVRIDAPAVATRLVWLMTDDHATVAVPQHKDTFSIFADQPVHGSKSDVVCGPGTPVEGVVKDQETGKPIAGGRIVSTIPYRHGIDPFRVETTTDGQGRYRLLGRPAQTPYRVTVLPPKGEPYLTTSEYPPRVEPGMTAQLDFAVKRGVFVSGRVTDAATGNPLRAVVTYNAYADNPNLKDVARAWRSTTVSAADGTYTLVGLPGRGIVAATIDEMRRGRCVHGAGVDKVPGFEAKKQGFPTVPETVFPNMVNSLVAVEAKADGQTTANVQITTGRTVTGTIVDPDGKPVSGANIQGPVGANLFVYGLPSARFSIPAVDPDRPRPYFFIHLEKNLAAAVILKGDEPETFTVKLKPAGTASGRLFNEDGEPLANASISVRIEPGQLGLTMGWSGFLNARTDKDGNFRIPGLIPGVRFSARVMRDYRLAEKVFDERTFESGQVVELGEVRVKPVGGDE